MKGFIFSLLLVVSIYAQAQFECDSEILGTVKAIFDNKKDNEVHRCLHAQGLEKVVAIVEREDDLGALSLFVFSEEGLSETSNPISYIESFAIDGLRDVPSKDGGLKINKGIGYFYREAFKEGVIVLQYKNENDFYDVSLIRLDNEGKLKNYELGGIESRKLAISQTNNMDLYVFKVSPEQTIDIIPWSNKVVIDSRFDPTEKREFYLGGRRMPASISAPKK